jgi:allantoate deiminase
MINQKRLFDRINELGQIGRREEGGVIRLSFTEEEKQAKDLIISYMTEAGLSIREDAIGNLIGRMEGTVPGAAAVLVGSHIDSVPNGGNFDGPLGVLAGIEVLQSMKEQGVKTVHPIEVIAFKDEEGTRFGFGMIGSRAIAGTLKLEDLQHADGQGISIADAMKSVGLDPERISDAARKQEDVKAYVELHIEQGKVLESYNLPAGVVSGIAGPLWLKFTLTGEAGHAGATPMKMRKDPMVAAAKIISYIEDETSKYPNAVGTVGKASISPGGVNVIPKQIEFTLDLRDIDQGARNEIEQNIVSYAQQICNDRGIELSVGTLQRVAPAPCSREIRQTIEKACEEVGITPFTLTSGAGHDGMQFRNFCPVGMIFVRSQNGVSHDPGEWSSADDCGVGAEILYHTILQLAEQCE